MVHLLCLWLHSEHLAVGSDFLLAPSLLQLNLSVLTFIDLLRHDLQEFFKAGSQFTQSLTGDCFFTGLFNVINFLEILQNPAFNLLCVQFGIYFFLGKLFILLKFIMKIEFFSLDKKILLSFFLKSFSVLEKFLLFFFHLPDSFLIISYFAQELCIYLFFMEELVDKFLGIGNSSGDFYVFEGHLYSREFIHLIVHFSPQKIVY
jgi:hypothetical protein